MTKNEINQKIKEITDKIVAEYKPEKIILFGSYAWGTPHQDSDVDLLIIKETAKPRRERERELRSEIFPPKMPLDLLVYTSDEIEDRIKIMDFFIGDIINKGKVLYAAS